MNPINPSILADDPLLHRVWDQLGRPEACSVVGGYVRDRLLGRPSNDLDLTIDGDDDAAAGPAHRLGKAFGVRPHLLGTPPHRIWRIETSKFKIELWPLGGLSQDDDILRRDFTCNALSWELPHGPLVDLVGGIEDIEGRRLRAVSRSNLEDDPVRLLRGPRFLAQLIDFELDERTRRWIVDLAPSLEGAPRERVGQELLTLLSAQASARGLKECLDQGLFVPAAPPTCAVDAVWLRAHLDAADHLNCHPNAGGTQARCRSGDPLDAARLALLFRAWGLPSERDVAPYSWQKAVRDDGLRAAFMLAEAQTAVKAAAADRREFAWRAGSAFPSLIALAMAIESQNPGWARWLRQWHLNRSAIEDPQPLLTGNEIAKIVGIDPGPELGEVVRGLLRAQVRGEIRSRGGAVRWLERHSESR